MSNVTLEVKEMVAEITMNRPKALNALNTQTLVEIEEIIHTLSNDKSIRAVVITGSGEKAFVAGADIKEMLNLTPVEAREFSLMGQRVFSGIESLPQVVIAAINGFALGGGCELALACDIRIASEKAKFAQPEINLGIIPGYAGTQRLPRLIGLGRAKEMIFSGDMIDAQEAYRIGLVNKVCQPQDVMSVAREFAAKFAAKSISTIKNAKTALNEGFNMNFDSACIFEAYSFSQCFTTDDQREGMSAFLEKRKAKFN